jgi:HAD superfamily hydrolase (TIGR01549 family)
MQFQAIFFDLDDTLYDQQKPFSDTIRTIFPVYCHSLSIEELYKTFRHFSDLLWKEYSEGKLTLEELRIQRIMVALKDYQITISKEEAEQFQLHYESALQCIQLFSEAPWLLKNLMERGFTLGIITNGPIEHQRKKIQNLGLTKFISDEWIFISDAVGVAKPNPQIFHEVANKIAYPPETLLYIGDSWRNDIVASCEAGWNAIWYNHRNRTPDTHHRPLAEVERLSSIVEVLTF